MFFTVMRDVSIRFGQFIDTRVKDKLPQSQSYLLERAFGFVVEEKVLKANAAVHLLFNSPGEEISRRLASNRKCES